MHAAHLRSRGFTVLELLVVIAVIGILSAVILVSVSTAREKSRVAKTKSQLHQIETAFRLMQVSSGDYPPLPIGTDFCNMCLYWPASVVYANGNWQTDVIDQLMNAGVLKADYGSDPWGRPYLYDKNFQMGPYTCTAPSPICSMGPDGVLQTPNCQNSGVAPAANGDDICIFLVDEPR